MWKLSLPLSKYDDSIDFINDKGEFVFDFGGLIKVGSKPKAIHHWANRSLKYDLSDLPNKAGDNRINIEVNSRIHFWLDRVNNVPDDRWIYTVHLHVDGYLHKRYQFMRLWDN